MLTRTFLHLPGIGVVTEQRLWDSGIRSWNAFVDPHPIRLSPNRTQSVHRHLDESRKHLEKDHPGYFSALLPPKFHWRLFPEFRHSTVYLDIETTGLDGFSNDITVIGLYDGQTVYHYIRHQNLHDFTKDIEKYKVVVTYNGKCFDVPFIRNNLGVSMEQTHIDLRYVLQSVGLTGGLKRCEVQVGIDRGDLVGLDGFDAVFLWNDFERKDDQKALETLLAYNSQDIVNLETLMVMAYNLSLKRTPFFESNELPLPVVPSIPFKPDARTVERIKTAGHVIF